MNVYDFDDTIYNGDSTIDFYVYCLKKKPKLIIYLPKQIKGVLLYKLKKINKKRMKEYYFSFLNGIDKIEDVIEEFWEKNDKNIKEWYLKKKKEDDLVISASPEFLLWPICNRIGINDLIASKVNPKTGYFESENCKGEEKVKCYKRKYRDETIDEFYSDSYSDNPLAMISKKAFLVKGNEIKEWEEKKKKMIKNTT
jgi:HAD superfamily phosphoserine phosphatase-like hydrolase